MTLFWILALNVGVYFPLRWIGKRQKRNAIFMTLKSSAMAWEEAGWIPVDFSWDGERAVLTTRWRDSDSTELLVVD